MNNYLKIIDVQYKKANKVRNTHLALRGRITLIRGNSGTGKTYIIDFIRTLKHRKIQTTEVKASIDLEDLVIELETDAYSEGLEDHRISLFKRIKTCSNKIIIIDEADQILEGFDTLRKFIEHDTNNIYVLICRDSNLLNLGVTPANIATAVINNGVIELDYKYDVGGW